MTIPGELIDLHVHGIESRDTRTDSVDDIISIARYQKSKGVSAIVLSVYPDSIETMRQHMQTIKEAADRIHRRHMKTCADIIGVHLEGPFLSPKKKGALDSRHFLRPSVDALKRLVEGYEDLVKIITIAPELDGALRVIRHCRDMGINVNMGHSNATLREAEEGKNAGARGITHIFNAMRPFHHREPGLAGFGLMDRDIYVEVIVDGVHLNINTLRLIFAVKPPEKIIAVSDSVKGERSADRAVYREDGVLEGSGITLVDGADMLVQNGFDPHTVTLAMTSNPLRYVS